MVSVKVLEACGSDLNDLATVWTLKCTGICKFDLHFTVMPISIVSDYIFKFKGVSLLLLVVCPYGLHVHLLTQVLTSTEVIKHSNKMSITHST